MDEAFLTVKEFAAEIRMHYNSVIRSIRRGRIHAFRIGDGEKASYRIPRSEICRLGILDLENIVEKIVEKRLEDEKRIP